MERQIAATDKFYGWSGRGEKWRGSQQQLTNIYGWSSRGEEWRGNQQQLTKLMVGAAGVKNGEAASSN